MKKVYATHQTDGIGLPKLLLESASLYDLVTLITGDGSILLRKSEMESSEIIKTLIFLEQNYAELVSELAKKIPLNQKCEKCNFCQGILSDEKITLPSWVLKKLELDANSKLEFFIDNKHKYITINRAFSEFGLDFVPEPLRENLQKNGICLGDLHETLVSEEIIFSDKEADEIFD